ncbi:NAD synthetase [Cutibacterium acnes JCM 18916]|nr:NAD synthetase [Cutibacterium acnes JCM 18916]
MIDLSGRQKKSHAASTEIPFGPDQLFRATDLPDLTFHVEVCEDLWVPVAPSSQAALAGAVVEVNLSGSPITVGKSRQRHELCKVTSSRNLQAYVYAAAGPGESSTDLSWDGQTMIYENGSLLAATDRFSPEPATASPISTSTCCGRSGCVRGPSTTTPSPSPLKLHGAPPSSLLTRPTTTSAWNAPLIASPSSPTTLTSSPKIATSLQHPGLRTASSTRVNGITENRHWGFRRSRLHPRPARRRQSHGPDGPAAHRHPCFHNAGVRYHRPHQKNNALDMCRALGIPCEVLDIRPAATQMLKGMSHPAGDGAEVYDVTFENVQAGLRYDYLFRIANQRGGIVLGTGDLSELALGWCTFGVGDQMSHYGVNTGVPKTLIQHLIRWCISSGQFNEATNVVLESVLGTEISPELVPARPGEKIQSTQAKIVPTSCRTSPCTTCCATGCAPAGSFSCPTMPGGMHR